MSWAAVAVGVSVVSGVGSTLLGSQHAKKMSAKQAALAREQAQRLRLQAAEQAGASEREIETLRTLRSLDLPAFRQANEQAYIQAQKGAERMSRQRAMGRLAPDVRQAIFGGQFQQYVGREMQRLGQYAELTQQILRATEFQQQQAMQAEQAATQIEYGGQAQAIQMEAAAGDSLGSILGAVGQAASQFAMAQGAKDAALSKKQDAFMETALFSDLSPEDVAARRAEFGGQLGLGANYTSSQFWEAFFGASQ
jgi:hypothetical protein